VNGPSQALRGTILTGAAAAAEAAPRHVEALGRRSALRRVAWVLLLATLLLLPFEYWLPKLPVGRLTITSLEAVWMAAVLAWMATLAIERRPPRVGRVVLAALGVMLVAGIASALLAPGLNQESLIFVGRSAAGWLLFLAASDLVTDTADIRMVLIAIVVGASISALIGLAFIVSPDLSRALSVHQFVAAGAPRLSGTFDYPNTAAMSFEASALLSLALIALERRRALMWLWVALGAVLVLAMLLTLSRGAAVGAAIGLIVVAVLAWLSRRRRLGTALVVGAGLVVICSLLVEVAVAPIERLFTDAESGLYGATYKVPAQATLNNGSATVSVAITNTGSLPWNSAGDNEYQLGYHWLNPDTDEIVADGTQLIPLGTVAPGQSVTVTPTITAADALRGYRIAWDVVRGSGAWFSRRGVPVATTAVDVGTPSDPSTTGTELLLSGIPLVPPREDLWHAAVQMVSERPLLGVGPGTYPLRYGAYLGLPKWDERAYSHDIYLELGATTGIVGLAAFLVVVAGAVAPLTRSLVARARPFTAQTALEPRQWLAFAAILAAAVAFLGHGLFDYFFAFNPTNGLWWATLGLCVAVGRLTMNARAT
jgi:hypothetical protein